MTKSISDDMASLRKIYREEFPAGFQEGGTVDAKERQNISNSTSHGYKKKVLDGGAAVLWTANLDHF